jgi:hypothetical protein
MPQYNGPAYFFVEVLVHLLRNYLGWFVLFAILVPAPWLIWAAYRDGIELAVDSWLPLSVSSLVSATTSRRGFRTLRRTRRSRWRRRSARRCSD